MSTRMSMVLMLSFVLILGAMPHGMVKLVALEPAAPVAAVDAGEPVGPATQQFRAKLEQWTTLLDKMKALIVEAREADESRMQQIAAEFTTARTQADGMLSDIVAVAEAALGEAKADDPELGQFLAATVEWRVDSDRYEQGKELADRLLASPVKAETVHGPVALASLMIADIEACERHLDAAKENGTLDPRTEQLIRADLTEMKILWPIEQKLRAAQAESKLPRVLLETSVGDVTIELFEDDAPNTVANFVALVEKGFYDGITFHRVLPGFMAQGGCPDGTGGGGPGYTIKDEYALPTARKHFRGTLSMANTGDPNTNGSQFFLTFRPTFELNGKHTVFGRVIKGLDVLAEIQRRNPKAPNQPEPDKIVKAEVISKRDHAYQPETIPER